MIRQLGWAPRARRDLAKLERRIQERVIEAMERFAATGYGDIAKLTAVDPPEYRLRVGEHRVRFAILGDSVLALQVRKRSDAYR